MAKHNPHRNRFDTGLDAAFSGTGYDSLMEGLKKQAAKNYHLTADLSEAELFLPQWDISKLLMGKAPKEYGVAGTLSMCHGEASRAASYSFPCMDAVYTAMMGGTMLVLGGEPYYVAKGVICSLLNLAEMGGASAKTESPCRNSFLLNSLFLQGVKEKKLAVRRVENGPDVIKAIHETDYQSLDALQIGELFSRRQLFSVANWRITDGSFSIIETAQNGVFGCTAAVKFRSPECLEKDYIIAIPGVLTDGGTFVSIPGQALRVPRNSVSVDAAEQVLSQAEEEAFRLSLRIGRLKGTPVPNLADIWDKAKPWKAARLAASNLNGEFVSIRDARSRIVTCKDGSDAVSALMGMIDQTDAEYVFRTLVAEAFGSALLDLLSRCEPEAEAAVEAA